MIKLKILLAALILTSVFYIASTAVAMTEAERQALIAQIQQQLAQLTQQLNQKIAEQQGSQTWCYTFNNNLGYANSGTAEVANLHLALQKEGISYSPDDINTYSTGTSQGVISFQARYGISPQSGYVGPLTRNKLNQLYGCGSNITPPTTPPTTPACTPNWSCNSWSACSYNQQDRTCTDYNYCGTTTGRPALTQSCVSTPTCTPNWSCGSWSTCTSNQQARNCTDLNYCGVLTGAPSQTQACTPACTPDWSCGPYSADCVDGQQTRTCADSNNCGTTTGKPAETKTCVTADLKIDGSDGPIAKPYSSVNNLTVSWSSIGATSCSASGNWSGTKAISGSGSVLTGSLISSKTYIITCDNGTGGIATDSVVINISPPSIALNAVYVNSDAYYIKGHLGVTYRAACPTSCLLAVGPKIGDYDQVYVYLNTPEVLDSTRDLITLSWDSPLATSCAASKTNTGLYGGWSGPVPVSGSATIKESEIRYQLIYIVTCTNPGGTTTKGIVITHVWR